MYKNENKKKVPQHIGIRHGIVMTSSDLRGGEEKK